MRISFLILLMCVFGAYGQKADSLKRLFDNSPDDTAKISLCVSTLLPLLEDEARYDEMVTYAVKAQSLAKKIGSAEQKIKSSLKLSWAYMYKEKISESLAILDSILPLCKRDNMIKEMAFCYRQKARLFYFEGDYPKSTEFYIEAQKQWEILNDPKYLAIGYGDLAASNFYIGHYDRAAEYWEKEVQIEETSGEEKSAGNALGNIGLAYIELKNFYKAEISFKKAIVIAQKYDNKKALANAYTNFCKLKYEKGDLDGAIEYCAKAINICEVLGDSSFLSNNYSNGAELLRSKKRYDEAINYITKAYEIESRRHNETNIGPILFNRAAIYFDLGNYKAAYDDLKSYVNVTDSLLNIDNQRNINELEKKYELDQKEKANQILNQQVELGNAESSRQRLLLLFGAVVIVAMAVIAFVLIRQNRIKHRVNKELHDKNHIIEEQHKDITDSIKYAKRIQDAILPPDQFWYNILPNSFVLFKPKDILSGDFYWIEETEDTIFVAAADCTGHGVPGALMSIVNFNLLNKAVKEKDIYDPGEILSAVNVWLTHSLHQTFNESSIKDGMDLSLISINKRTSFVKYAGAFNSIYHFSEANGFREIKGDKFPVGAFIEESIKRFTTHDISVQKGDMLYVFSDGYADQFGGPKGKKFKYNRLKELMSKIKHESTEKQKEILDQEFENWKGIHEQIDDVCVIGIKI